MLELEELIQKIIEQNVVEIRKCVAKSIVYELSEFIYNLIGNELLSKGINISKHLSYDFINIEIKKYINELSNNKD